MENQFVYLVLALAFAPIWLLIYIRTPKQRKEMLYIGLLVGVLSACTSYFWWTKDWWSPETITGTKVGVEDFLTGFFAGGIMSAVYEYLYQPKEILNKSLLHKSYTYGVVLMLILVTSISFYGCHIPSAYSAFISIVIACCFVGYIRSDLLRPMFVGGVLMGIISIIPYAIAILFFPEWLVSTYPFELSGIAFKGVPVEEFIFWFLGGALFSVFYEFKNGIVFRSGN